MGVIPRNRMHDIAYDYAVSHGPRLVMVNDKRLAAYALSKVELAKIFEKEGGYSSDRIAWLKAIRAWGRYYDDAVPVDKVLFNVDAEWNVIFMTMGGSKDFEKLDTFASAHYVDVYMRQPQTPLIVDYADNLGGQTA